MAQTVVSRLEADEYVEWVGDRKGVIESLDRVIQDELSLEDRLNAEVRQLLKAYEKQIEQGQVDYQKMFQMVKQKLVRERNLIL